MKRSAIIATALLGSVLGGCASLVEGTSQDIHVDVTPSSATCSAHRQGDSVGMYDPNRGILYVGKSRHDIQLTCRAPGYKSRTVVLRSDASGWGIVGAMTLDFGVVDYISGALNKYDDTLTVVLEPTSRKSRRTVFVGPEGFR